MNILLIFLLNFREFLTAKDVDFSEKSLLTTKGIGTILREFQEYFYFGGFPESLSHIEKREYISSIYQKILLGDMSSRNGIRNTHGIKIMMKKIAETVKDEVSYSKLHGILKTIGVAISKDVVIDYVGYAQESYLIFAVRNYFSKFVDKETTPKYYFSDNGLLNLFLTKGEPRLLENLTAVSLRNIYNDEIYYLKTSAVDVDFFIPETFTVVQASYSIKDISRDREIAGIKAAAKTVKEAKRFVIITYEEEETIIEDGLRIEVIPLWKWLIKLD